MVAQPSTEIEASSTGVLPDAGRRAVGMRRKATAYSLLGAASILLVWALLSQYTRTEFVLLPSPLAVLRRMGDLLFGDPNRHIPPGTVFINSGRRSGRR